MGGSRDEKDNTTMIMNRRGILLGLASALAAPAIVHAGNLMPVKALKPEPFTVWIHGIDQFGNKVTEKFQPPRLDSKASWLAYVADNSKLVRTVHGISVSDPWDALI